MFNQKIITSGLILITWLTIGIPLKAKANPSIISDGLYLYGQSPKPSQIGKDYLILKATNGQVVGGLYRPNSEFYCFTGKVEGEQLKLSFSDPSSGTTYKHEIAITSFREPVASGKLPLKKVSLNGFNPIDQLSEIDHQILKACSTK